MADFPRNSDRFAKKTKGSYVFLSKTPKIQVNSCLLWGLISLRGTGSRPPVRFRSHRLWVRFSFAVRGCARR